MAVRLATLTARTHTHTHTHDTHAHDTRARHAHTPSRTRIHRNTHVHVHVRQAKKKEAKEAPPPSSPPPPKVEKQAKKKKKKKSKKAKKKTRKQAKQKAAAEEEAIMPPPPPPPTSLAAPLCFRERCTPEGSDQETPYCLPGWSSHSSAGFACPAREVVEAACDAEVGASAAWRAGDAADAARIRGDPSSAFVPFEARATRRSTLDPTELVPAFDEVWTDGICLVDSWQWRPIIDVFHTLMGQNFLFRLYVVEIGGPVENYARAECDLLSWTNDYSDGAFWRHELGRARNGDFVQTIDVSGGFCGASEGHETTQYRWSAPGRASGQCQLYPGARYSIKEGDLPGGHEDMGTTGQYIFTPPPDWNSYSEFVHAHEMLHLAQNAQHGRRLYAEHGTDGECCTIWMEHIAYVTYSGYKERLPERFPGLELSPPWNGWRVDNAMAANGFGSSGLYPEWMRLTYPEPWTTEAQQQKWSTATFVQSAYRAYTAVRNDDGSYRNHALMTVACHDWNAFPGGCAQYEEPDVVYEALSEADKVHYSEEAGGSYGIVFDITYRLKNLATQYFTYKANAAQPGGFGAYEFFMYELQNPRASRHDNTDGGMGANFPSDGEMFGLAGYAGRREFLEDFHAWMVANLEGERTPLEVAEEITQPQAGLLADIERLKARNLVSVDEAGPRCGDDDMPSIRFD